MTGKRVYFAHSMEGLAIPTESGRRGRAARELLGESFRLLLAEDWQDRVDLNSIEEEDLKQLDSASIILADLHNIGLKSNSDIPILCLGTNQEIGYAKKSGKYVVVIGRNPKNMHPFHVPKSDGGKFVDYYTTSLEDACHHIIKKFGKDEKQN